MKNCWSSVFSRLVAIALGLCPFLSPAQFSRPEVKFPAEEKYLYPINPGLPGSLAGNMGELRTTHFHSGIDIRTNNVIGLPVLASKSGYVSRVSVSPSGYGNVMYIAHPDGNTTLYAHLDEFNGALAEHVLREQYKRKTANVNLYFTPDKFKVKQGDTIALSGNSGSSGGPHLHFDIRDRDNFALDPLIVEAFPEIIDRTPPAVEKIALKTLDVQSRINDKFGRFEFYAQRSGNNYVFPVPILASGNIGIEILAKDKFDPKSPFYGGVNYIQVHVDSQLVFNQSIDKINIAETRGIYTLMDFKTMRTSGSRFYKLYIDDGNGLSFYSQSPTDGKIRINPAKTSSVQITMRDSHGNKSTVSLKLRPSPPVKETPLLEPLKVPFSYELEENVIVLSSQPCAADSGRVAVYSHGIADLRTPDYGNHLRNVHLIDLRKGLPDSIVVCGQVIEPKIKAMIPSGRDYTYYGDLVEVKVPQSALFDTLYLNLDHRFTGDSSAEIFTIGSRLVPLERSVGIKMRTKRPVAWNKQTAVYRVSGNSASYLGGKFENGAIHFMSRELGDFMVLRDTIAPAIKPVSMNGTAVRFKIKDDLSGISNYEANINGEWLLMHYDPKSATIWSEKLDKKKLLRGTLTLVVTDEAGNRSTFTHTIP